MTPRRFLAARWRGQVAIERLLWRDMVLVGTAINVVASVLALGLLVAGGPAWLAVLAHLLPMPYNVFLCIAVWRAAASVELAVATLARGVSLAWLVLVAIV